jgi:hypothetical protein
MTSPHAVLLLLCMVVPGAWADWAQREAEAVVQAAMMTLQVADLQAKVVRGDNRCMAGAAAEKVYAPPSQALGLRYGGSRTNSSTPISGSADGAGGAFAAATAVVGSAAAWGVLQYRARSQRLKGLPFKLLPFAAQGSTAQLGVHVWAAGIHQGV